MFGLPEWLTRRRGNLLGLLACAMLMGYALYVQHVLGLEPCPLCILQRVSVITAGVLFLVAALHDPGDRIARAYGVLIDVAALGGILVASRHIWVIAQPPGSVAECGGPWRAFPPSSTPDPWRRICRRAQRSRRSACATGSHHPAR